MPTNPIKILCFFILYIYNFSMFIDLAKHFLLENIASLLDHRQCNKQKGKGARRCNQLECTGYGPD